MSRIDEFGGWPALLTELVEKRDLPAAHARAAMATILSGDATAAQLIGFVVALRAKGESPDGRFSGYVARLLADLNGTKPAFEDAGEPPAKKKKGKKK